MIKFLKWSYKFFLGIVGQRIKSPNKQVTTWYVIGQGTWGTYPEVSRRGRNSVKNASLHGLTPIQKYLNFFFNIEIDDSYQILIVL